MVCLGVMSIEDRTAVLVYLKELLEHKSYKAHHRCSAQGVDSTLMNANMDDGSQSEPTLIEKLCATFQKKFNSCYYTGKYSSCLMRDTVKTLADMQKLPDKIFFFKEGKLLLKMVVEKCGLDAIMAIIPQEHVEVMELLAEAKRRAEKAISGGLVGAAKMTKKPKL
ncbi:hypothetical protein ACLB2K_000754 [Fragaria x ananassa]